MKIVIGAIQSIIVKMLNDVVRFKHFCYIVCPIEVI